MPTALSLCDPQIATDDLNPGYVDCDGMIPAMVAVQQVGAVSGAGARLDGELQESDDHLTWSDNGVSFDEVTAGSAQQAIVFNRRKRYVRWLGWVAGTTPSIAVAVTLMPVV